MKNKPNVIFISLDCLRKDKLSFYKESTIKTPNIEKFVKDNTHWIFNNAIAQSSFTTSSHTSMLTCVVPPKHNIRHNFSHQINKSKKYLVQKYFKENGYYTKGVVSCFHLDDIGLEEGFDEYIYHPKKKDINVHAAARFSEGTESINLALKNLENKDPYFLFLHLYDAHKNDQKYLDAITYLDNILQKVFDFAKKTNALTVITSDHGIYLKGEHNYPNLVYKNIMYHNGNENGPIANGLEVYDELIKIPLAIVWNGLKDSKNIDRQIGQIDIFPTIFDILKIKYLLDEVDGKTYEKNNPVQFSETYIPGYVIGKEIPIPRQISLRYNNKLKFIFSEQKAGLILEEMYNLINDPKETKNFILTNFDWAQKFYSPVFEEFKDSMFK